VNDPGGNDLLINWVDCIVVFDVVKLQHHLPGIETG